MTRVDEPAKWIEALPDPRAIRSGENHDADRHERALLTRLRKRLGLKASEPLPEDRERED